MSHCPHWHYCVSYLIMAVSPRGTLYFGWGSLRYVSPEEPIPKFNDVVGTAGDSTSIAHEYMWLFGWAIRSSSCLNIQAALAPSI